MGPEQGTGGLVPVAAEQTSLCSSPRWVCASVSQGSVLSCSALCYGLDVPLTPRMSEFILIILFVFSPISVSRPFADIGLSLTLFHPSGFQILPDFSLQCFHHLSLILALGESVVYSFDSSDQFHWNKLHIGFLDVVTFLTYLLRQVTSPVEAFPWALGGSVYLSRPWFLLAPSCQKKGHWITLAHRGHPLGLPCPSASTPVSTRGVCWVAVS